MKKITIQLLPFVLVFCSGIINAQFSQVWDAQFQHTTSSGFSNEGRRIAEDPSGNIFELADVTSDIDPGGMHGALTYHYVTINKYSTNGTLLNSKNITIQKHINAGFNNISGFGLELDGSGNVYIGYTTWDAATGYDIALAKYDNNLVRLGTNIYSTTANEEGIEIKLHASGTLYAIIKSVSGTTTYSLIKSVPGFTAALLVYNFPVNSAVINCLTLDAAQKAFVGGYSVKAGYRNAYVAAINIASNTLTWGSVYTPSSIAGDDEINKITLGIDGNVYAVGTSYQGSTLGNQALVLKNLPGNPHFSFVVLLGNPGENDKGLLINAAESGWVYVGSVAGNYTNVYRFPSSGSFVTPAKVTFAPVPTAQYNSINALTLNSMKVSSAKNVYITGGIAATGNMGDFNCAYLSKGSVVFGNALVRVGGNIVKGDFDMNYDGLDINLDYGKSDVYWLCNFWDDAHNTEQVLLFDMGVTGTLRETSPGALINGQVNIAMSPNPASGKLTISAGEMINNIEIMDMTGKRVLFASVQSSEETLDVSALRSGIYFCKVHTASTEQTCKLIIK